MRRLDLGGTWLLAERGGNPRVAEPVPAEVPGVVHTALMAAGELADPRIGLAEAESQWVGQRAWSYRRSFELPRELAACEVLEWVCEGLDTLCDLRWNGRRVARADNQFRTWRSEVSGTPAGAVEVELRFASVFPYLKAKNAERPCPGWGVGVDKDDTGAWVRKSPFNFGWDWAPKLVTAGPWRPLRVEGWSTARVEHLQWRQHHAGDGGVELSLAAALRRAPSGRDVELDLEVDLRLQGKLLRQARARGAGEHLELRFGVPDPQLWWPRELGPQPLYDLRVRLRDPRSGEVLETCEQRLGLRRVELVREGGPHPEDESFRFRVNGRDLFLRGANWIPARAFPVEHGDPARDREAVRALLERAAAAHVNTLRVWGGGLYEHDAFYDLCDELGILVWQDFCFACTTYPAFDAAFRENVRAEARDQVRRLHHRASLFLWCGNNEVENGLAGPRWTATRMGWSDYGRLFDELLADVVSAEDPDTPYWPGSPHSPRGDRMRFNAERSGDAHLWTVWHGGERFEAYLESEHRFLSEFGFQSHADPRSNREVSRGVPVTRDSAVLAAHQKAPIAPERLRDALGHYFGELQDFTDEQLATQWLQAWGLRLGLDHWRRRFPHCGGVLFWQWSDIWVAPTWSAIDGAGRTKALYHALAEAFAPRTITARATRQTIELFVHDDSAQPTSLHWRWSVWSTRGFQLHTERGTAKPDGHGRARRVARVPLAKLAQRYGLRTNDVLCFAELAAEPAGPPLAHACAWSGTPGSLSLIEPQLRATRIAEDRWELVSERPALFVTPRVRGWELPSGLHLEPGVPRTLAARPDAGSGSLAQAVPIELRHLARAIGRTPA